MIRLRRITDPKIIVSLEPHCVFDDIRDRPVFIQQMLDLLRTSPDRLFVVVAFDDSNIVAFVIAHLALDAVWIVQAWNTSVPAVAAEMFLRVKLWTLSMGQDRIKAQSARSTEALYRRFGFEEVSRNVVYELPASLTTNLVAAMKGLSNG